MSAPKRPQADAVPATALPPSKRAKTSQDQPSSLSFLTDERQRAGKTIQAKLTNGAAGNTVNRVDESKAAIKSLAVAQVEDQDVDDASSVVSSSSEASIQEDQDRDEESDGKSAAVDVEPEGDGDLLMTNGIDHSTSDKDISSEVVINGAKENQDQGTDNGPSFGDLLQVSHPEIIDVNSALEEEDLRNKQLTTTESTRALQAPSGNSLGTVLSQALRTNDRDLLESCLQTRDIVTIKATIQRLQSPLVATLMQRLAERLHKRPGRAGPLLVWVQWSLVAHGGYLASQPHLVKQLRSLRQVVRERSNSLQSLIVLKGKLDMLGAQIELRRSMRAQRADAEQSDDDEDDIIHIDGSAESSAEESDDEADLVPITHRIRGGPEKIKALMARSQNKDENEDLDEDIELINGVDEDAEMDSMEEDDEEEGMNGNGFIDDEAEESEGEESVSTEEDDADSVDDSDNEERDDESDSREGDEVAVQPGATGKQSKRNGLLRKR